VRGPQTTGAAFLVLILETAGFTQRLHPGILVASLDDVDVGAYQLVELRLEDYRRVPELAIS
jgi:hypothetical protein